MRKFAEENMQMNLPVYLDYNSTTPVDKRVLEVMLPYFSENFGNAASKTHAPGWIAEEAVKHARGQVAKLINSGSEEIIFTSGATEAINLALKGVFEAYHAKGNHIITVATEHKAVLDACRHLEKSGAHVTYLSVNRDGLIDLNLLEKSIQKETVLVAVMFANNETGVIQPIREISKIVHGKNCILMSDATQACGKVPVNVEEEGVDLLCLSAHKFYGPKGTGALYVRRKNPRVALSPLIDGGGHERGLRSGTLNVPAIAGFGKACEIASQEMDSDAKRISDLRNTLERLLTEAGNVSVNGSRDHRLFNVTNLSFHGVNANALVGSIKDLAVATGSACTSAIPEPSHVLRAMIISEELAFSSVRFSLGKYSTSEEIQFTVKRVKEAVEQLRAIG